MGRDEMRQSAEDWADDGDAMAGEIPGGTGRDRTDDSDERAGNFGGKALEEGDANDDDSGEKDRGKSCARQAAEELKKLHGRVAGANFDAEHFAEDGDAHLESDTGEEAHKDGPREEIGEEA